MSNYGYTCLSLGAEFAICEKPATCARQELFGSHENLQQTKSDVIVHLSQIRRLWQTCTVPVDSKVVFDTK